MKLIQLVILVIYIFVVYQVVKVILFKWMKWARTRGKDHHRQISQNSLNRNFKVWKHTKRTWQVSLQVMCGDGADLS